ncbi:MAG: ABC transporter permease [Proteobacteria bacterium]|nr:ABC transporter permease [Pseudomonadota bacterium]
MIKNYIVIALRNISRHKLYAAINIGGLALGLAAAALIALFVRDELSYDNWIPGHEQIYRIHSTFEIPGRSPFRTVRSAGRILPAMMERFPGIEEGVRMVNFGRTVYLDGEAFDERMMLADAEFFDLFDLPFAEGDAESAFTGTRSVILSQALAHKYFGDQPALGEILNMKWGDEMREYRVGGVLANLPGNTHLRFGMIGRIVPSDFVNNPGVLDTWTSVNTYGYFRLAKGANIAEIERQVPAFLDSVVPAPADMDVAVSDFYKLSFMRVADIYLGAKAQAADMGDMRRLGDMSAVITFSAVAILILAIATINFMNLSTARASLRAREVSMRKVLGAERKQLVFQFLGESVVTTAIALTISLALVELALPWFNAFLGKTLSLPYIGGSSLLPVLVGMALVVGLIGGLYPAFYLTGFRPAKILRANQSADSDGNGRFRSLLVVLQFAISIGLIVSTAVIYGQSLYAKNLDLGFDKENKLVLRGLGGVDATTAQTLIQELKRHPDVTDAVLSSDVPTDNWENNARFSFLTDEGAQNYLLNYVAVDYGFMEAYAVEPIAGRLFSKDFGADNLPTAAERGPEYVSSIILNSAATRLLGIIDPADAIGKIITSGLAGEDMVTFTIIGVVPDMQFRSAHYGVQPSVFWRRPASFDNLTVAFSETDYPGFIAEVEALWTRVLPDARIDHHLLDDLIAAQYYDEDQQATMFAAFSGLAIIIASLGLYGLAAFSAERRTREIGLRKVLGAGVMDIVQLLVWQFSKPVLLANLIAWPLAWYFMADWLTGFEYRMTLNPALFAGAGASALFIAWITVAGHAFRVARANPINALRCE